MSQRISTPAAGLLVLMPGALVVALGFSAGGFFPGVVALTAIGLGLALVLRLTLAHQPFAGLSLPFVLGVAALGLFTIWTLVSSGWSDAPARALLEYDRALLYLLVFVLCGALGRTPQRLRWMLRAIALGATVVCVCGLATRLLPDVWSVAPSPVENERLGYPLTYWNALGLLAAVGLVLCLGLTCDLRESRIGRVLAAAALPALGATLLLTFSRGAVVAVVVGLAVLLVVGRPGAIVSGLLVAVPSVAVAVRATYDAELLATVNPTTAPAIAQGHDLAMVVGICALAGAVARALLLVLDGWIDRQSLPERLRGPRVRWAGRAGLAAAVVVAAVALGVPGEIERRYDGFRGVAEVDDSSGVRSRLGAVGNNGRLVHWEVAMIAFRENRLRGDGAGTYALRWDKDRPQTFQVEDAHSLYYEVLGELGLVGMVLLGAALLLILGGLLVRARGPDRMVGAALFAAALTWALHAGVDWDWEMPAITLWVFAAGGLALSAAASAPATEEEGGPAPGGGMRGFVRVLVGLGCLVLLVVPVTILRSQGPLVEAARAFARGDCPAAIEHALDSTAALAVRPEPFIVLGYCDVRLGQDRLGVEAMRNAVRLDPDNWESHYGLALVSAAAGLDPRPAAREAARLNPSDSDLATAAVTLFAGTTDPRAWRRRALRATLPTQ